MSDRLRQRLEACRTARTLLGKRLDAQVAENQRLIERVEELEEVLGFYAELDNHTLIQNGATPVHKDGGEKARRAIH